MLADDLDHLRIAGRAQRLAVQGSGAGEQLVEDRAKCIHIAARVGAEHVHLADAGVQAQRVAIEGLRGLDVVGRKAAECGMVLQHDASLLCQTKSTRSTTVDECIPL